MSAVPPTTTAPPPFPTDRGFSILGDLRVIVTDLLGARDLLFQLVRRDVTVKYKQAFFGFAWAVLIPLVVVMAGITVRLAMAHAGGRELSTTQMASLAIKSVPWAFFVGCVNSTTLSLVANMSLVTKVQFPREVLPLSAVLGQSVDSGIGLLVTLILLPFLGVSFTMQALWAPVLLALLWMLALGLGLLLSAASLFFRDVKYLVQVFLTFGIFLTPVMLDAPMYGRVGCRVLMLNPVAPILEGLRLSVIEHHNLLNPLAAPQGFPFWGPGTLAYVAAWSIGVLLLAAVAFHRAEERFAEAA